MPRFSSSSSVSREEDRATRGQEEKAETKGKPENKKGERVKGGLGCLDPGGSYYGGEKRDEGGALRLHSSANRGIFVRFLFENKTLPTTPGANKKGDEGGMRRLKWIGFVRIWCMCIYDECLNFNLLPEILAGNSISG